jgi:hypothetical protein
VKSPLKALLLSFVSVLGILALTWGFGILYWHFRIGSALRAWEKTAKITRVPMVTDSGIPANDFTEYGISANDSKLLYDAGCRALPYLVKALQSSSDPEFQQGLVTRIIQCLTGPGPYNEQTYELLHERESRWFFLASNLDLEREKKLADFDSWWRSNGHRYHRWWKFWSPWCAGELK